MNNASQYPNLIDSILLQNLGENDRRQFLNRCSIKSYAETTMLLEQDKPSPGLFLIASGNVNVFCTGPDGATVMLSRYRFGSTLGEVEAITEQLCVASCEMQSAGTVLFAPRSVLLDMLRVPGFVRSLFQISYDRMQRDNRFRALNVNQSIPVKLANYLLMLANSKGEVHESQAFLAQIISCSRQTINKELGILRDAEVVSLSRGRIQILSKAKLEAASKPEHHAS